MTKTLCDVYNCPRADVGGRIILHYPECESYQEGYEQALKDIKGKVDDLEYKLSAGCFFICTKCRDPKDSRSTECSAAKWKRRYDQKCEELAKLKEKAWKYDELCK